MGDAYIERLKQLSELHKSGALTDDEFASKKAEILTLAPIGFVEDRSTEPPPPAPTAPAQDEPSKASMIVGGVVMVAIVVAIVWGIVAIASGGGRERPPDPIRLSAEVGLANQGLTLRVSNNDPFHWEHITFYLDGIMNGYTYKHRMIAPDGVIDIRLNDFVAKDGIRYAPQMQKPQDIYISATVPGDGSLFVNETNGVEGNWSGGW